MKRYRPNTLYPEPRGWVNPYSKPNHQNPMKNKLKRYVALDLERCFWCLCLWPYCRGYLYGPYMLCGACDLKARELMRQQLTDYREGYKKRIETIVLESLSPDFQTRVQQ